MSQLVYWCEMLFAFCAVAAVMLFAWLCLSNALAIGRIIKERKRLEREGE